MHARRVFDVALRAGFHYDAFVTRDVGNAGRLPREHLVGSVVGARIEIAPPRSRVNVSLRFDALVLGARAQTTNLEDGEDSTARATWAGATLRIPLGHTLSLQSTFDHARATKRLGDRGGVVLGAVAQDERGSGKTAEIRARAVVNATGVWADELRTSSGGAKRPPRGEENGGSISPIFPPPRR